LDDRGVFLDIFAILHNAGPEIVSGGLNYGEGSAEFVGHTGREFHLKVSETPRAASRNHHRHGPDTQNHEHAEADGQVAPFELLSR
jgi:hypothetical protein